MFPEHDPIFGQPEVSNVRHFIGFVILSGLGWLCDFATFTLLVKELGVVDGVANIVSSYVGVTFVWFTSLKTVFKGCGDGRNAYLLVYWGFQLLSILAYSTFLHEVANSLRNFWVWGPGKQEVEMAAKVIVTPFNLVTNYLFMKLLTRFMHQECCCYD